MFDWLAKLSVILIALIGYIIPAAIVVILFLIYFGSEVIERWQIKRAARKAAKERESERWGY